MADWQLDQKDEAKQWYDKTFAWQTANDVKFKADAERQGFFAEAAKLMALANRGDSAVETNTETKSKKTETRPADSGSYDESEASWNGD